MKRLAPSILSSDFSRLGEEIKRIESAGAHLVHIDVMDGHFVPNISIGPVVVKSIAGKTKLPFDIHLMIEDPDRYAAEFVTDNTEFITVHAESCIHLHRSIQYIKSLGVKAGVSLNPATPLSFIENMLSDIDMVLLMSVNPGFGGQKFIPFVLDKVKELDWLKREKGLSFEIEIDGGITLENIEDVSDAGVTIAVAGAAVFGSTDIYITVKEMIEKMNQK